MSKLDIAISYHLPPSEAQKRIQNLLTGLKNKYADNISDLQEEWKGGICRFSFSAMGFSVSGEILVLSEEVRITGILPWTLTVLKSKIETMIREQAEKLLA